MNLDDLPNMEPNCLKSIDIAQLAAPDALDHPPRILMLYGSLRAGSYSRKSAQEGARILQAIGCEVRMFDPTGLPLLGIEGADQDPKVLELRDLAIWSEGIVWSSLERHGAMLGITKLQIDWLPLSMRGGAPNAGQDAGADAGLWRLAKF